MARSNSRPDASAPRTTGLLRGLRARYDDALHRLVSDRDMQRRFVRIPILSWFARRRAAALFDLCAGFVHSQIFYACVRLRLLERLAEGPRSAAALAHDTGLEEAVMVRLLEAARGIGLVEPRAAGLHALTLDGAAYLGNPGLAAMIEHHAMLYRDLADPLSLLCASPGHETELRRFWAYDGGAVGGGADYSALMATSLPLLADDVLDAYPIRAGRVLDVGGGSGAFVASMLARSPNLDMTLFDLPSVIEFARDNLSARGLGHVRLRAGDARRDALPGPVDVITLCRILHDHDDEDALSLVRRAREALAPGGALVIAEPMASPGRRDPLAAYFGFYFLAMGQGRLRSPAEVSALLTRAGFATTEVRSTRQPLLARVVVGTTPRPQ